MLQDVWQRLDIFGLRAFDEEWNKYDIKINPLKTCLDVMDYIACGY